MSKVYTVSRVDYLGDYAELSCEMLKVSCDRDSMMKLAKDTAKKIKDDKIEVELNGVEDEEEKEEILNKLFNNITEYEHDKGFYFEMYSENDDEKYIISMDESELE